MLNVSLQEGIEAALRQQNGTGEAVEVHPGFFFNDRSDKTLLSFDWLTGIGVRNLVLLILQVAFSFFPCPALFPVAAEPASLGFKEYLGIAFTGLAGHYLIPALGDFPKAWRSAIKCQTDGIKNCRLARTGGTG